MLAAQLSHGSRWRNVTSVAFSPHLLASAGQGMKIRLRDATTGQHLRTLTATGHISRLAAVTFSIEIAFSPDAQLLASTSCDKTVRLWDPATGQHVRTLTGHTNWVNGVAFSPAGASSP